MFKSFILPIISLVALTTALPHSLKRDAAIVDQYIAYTGDGSNWPAESQWGSFADLWNANMPLISQSCGWNGWGADNSDAENQALNSAIQQVAGSTGVPASFILAIVMQESKGCVRVITTDNGVRNPGLMQSHNGAGTCTGVNPCPASEILQMIQDGVAGTSYGPGLQQLYAQASSATGTNGARAYYATARLYNSGSADYTNLDNGLGSTACYAEDVANRLTGWTRAGSNCQA